MGKGAVLLSRQDPGQLRPFWGNIVQGAIEVGGPAVFGAVVTGAFLADAGFSTTTIVLAVAGVGVLAALLIAFRYAPMFVALDACNDQVRFRNAWHSGVLRWSEIEGFEPSAAFLGYTVASAVLPAGRQKLRAAKYDEFVAMLG